MIPRSVRWRVDPRPWFLGLRVGADWRGVRAVRNLELGYRWGDGVKPPVSFSARPLDGHDIYVRPGTSDIVVVQEVLVGMLHLPERAWNPREPQTILDLGAHIGLSVADMAARFPSAQIVGVELDADNAQLAERNVRSWSSRCTIIHGAAWPRPGTVRYVRDAGRTYSHRIARDPDRSHEGCSARAYPISELLDLAGGGAGKPVDYLKMDVEGSEFELLTEETEWARRVRSIQVEVHAPYGVERCVSDLQALNFAVQRDRRNRTTVFGFQSAEPN